MAGEQRRVTRAKVLRRVQKRRQQPRAIYQIDEDAPPAMERRAIGVARLSPNWAVAKAALVYVETARNLPLLLHVLIWYNVVIRSLPPSRRSPIMAGPGPRASR